MTRIELLNYNLDMMLEHDDYDPYAESIKEHLNDNKGKYIAGAAAIASGGLLYKFRGTLKAMFTRAKKFTEKDRGKRLYIAKSERRAANIKRSMKREDAIYKMEEELIDEFNTKTDTFEKALSKTINRATYMKPPTNAEKKKAIQVWDKYASGLYAKIDKLPKELKHVREYAGLKQGIVKTRQRLIARIDLAKNNDEMHTMIREAALGKTGKLS